MALPVTSDLLSYEPEAFVRPVALKGFAQDGIEGFTSCPVVAGGVSRHGEGGHVDLQRKTGALEQRAPPLVSCTQNCIFFVLLLILYKMYEKFIYVSFPVSFLFNSQFVLFCNSSFCATHSAITIANFASVG